MAWLCGKWEVRIMLKGVNFIELKAGLPWENAFMVVDAPNEIVLKLIDDIHIAATYKVLVRNEDEYKVILYKFKAKHREEFLKAVAEIPNKALECGYKDYEWFCNDLINQIIEAKEGKNNGIKF